MCRSFHLPQPRYSQLQLNDLLLRALDLGFGLEAGSPIEGMMIKDLEQMIVREEHGGLLGRRHRYCRSFLCGLD